MRVRVLGRSDRTLISGGVKLDLNEVQAALDDWLGREAGIAVAVPSARWGERLGVCRLDGGSGVAPALNDADLAARLEARFGLAARHPVITSAGAALRLPSGKPDLAGYRELVSSKAQEQVAIANMNGDEQVN